MFRPFLICLLLLTLVTFGQSQVNIQGTVLDELSGNPLPGIIVTSQFPDKVTTDAEGHFIIRHAPDSPVYLVFQINTESIDWQLSMSASEALDLGTIRINPGASDIRRDLPTIVLDDIDDVESSGFSGLLRSGDDLFGGMTDYTFGPANFRRRGLQSLYFDSYLNNIPVNDLESGSIYYSTWGGLNDVMRNEDATVGSEFSDWSFGGIAGTSNTDLRASTQWRKKQVNFAVTNRNYRNRLMATWNTGLLPSGWAFSFSGSRRWAQEGYIPGTFYDGFSYFASIGRKFNEKHYLNLAGFGSPYQRGGNSSVIQEMYDIADNNYYNPSWGFQQGEKRSSKVYSGHQPIVILSHDWTPSEDLKVTTALGYQTGKNGNEQLDWLFAGDPRPDYYRRLPSFLDDPALAGLLYDKLAGDEALRQVQWDRLYEINLNSNYTIEDVDGIEGNDVTGRLSQYIMEDRRNDISKKSGNIVLEYQLSERSQIRAGASVVIQDTRNYKVITDLLGGEFYIDWDKFAEQDFPGNTEALQNDLRRPNRIVHVGDQVGYDYYSRIRQQAGWASYSLETSRWEIQVAGAVKNHSFFREGLTQNGKFPDSSFGESDKYNFFLPSGKGLLRYKIDGRNYFTLSGMVSENAPTFRNAFISPRTRNTVVSGLETEKLQSGEARYDYKSPYLKVSVSGFYITTKDGIESTSFYHDDLNTFANFTLTNIDKRFQGIEGAVQYAVIPGSLTVSAAASVGQYIYTSRPIATLTRDNSGSLLQENITIYAKNFFVAETPQRAYTAGLTYKSKRFWTLYLNINRFENNYIDFNPIRRTESAVELVETGSDQWNAIIRQEEVDPAWTIDLSFFKSWKPKWLMDDATVSLNIGITNLLNNTDYINGGFEQYRFDLATKDVNKFPTKYSYMEGLNYFLQLGLRF